MTSRKVCQNSGTASFEASAPPSRRSLTVFVNYEDQKSVAVKLNDWAFRFSLALTSVYVLLPSNKYKQENEIKLEILFSFFITYYLLI